MPLIAATSAVTVIEARRRAPPERVSRACARETRCEQLPVRLPSRIAGERRAVRGTPARTVELGIDGASCGFVVEDVEAATALRLTRQHELRASGGCEHRHHVLARRVRAGGDEVQTTDLGSEGHRRCAAVVRLDEVIALRTG